MSVRALTTEESDLLDDMGNLLGFLRKNPDLIDPLFTWSLKNLQIYCYSQEEFANRVKILGRAEKKPNDYSFNVTKNFGKIDLTVTTPRGNVCKQYATGEMRTVRKAVAYEEVEEPVMAWECTPSILSLVGE